MRWLNRLPGSIRSASGLEWALWRKLPAIWAVGTVLLGVIFFHEPASFLRLFFITTLIASIIGLKMVSH